MSYKKYNDEYFINKYNKLNEAEILDNLSVMPMDSLLKYRKFDEEFLEKIVSYCNMFTIMMYQKVSKKFIFDYILNDRYHDSDIDSTIDIFMVSKCQGYSIEELITYNTQKN